jgi:hypothetical protein
MAHYYSRAFEHIDSFKTKKAQEQEIMTLLYLQNDSPTNCKSNKFIPN